MTGECLSVKPSGTRFRIARGEAAFKQSFRAYRRASSHDSIRSGWPDWNGLGREVRAR